VTPYPGLPAITEPAISPAGTVWGLTRGWLFELDPATRTVVRPRNLDRFPLGETLRAATGCRPICGPNLRRAKSTNVEVTAQKAAAQRRRSGHAGVQVRLCPGARHRTNAVPAGTLVIEATYPLIPRRWV
jgi:hypothetical protein